MVHFPKLPVQHLWEKLGGMSSRHDHDHRGGSGNRYRQSSGSSFHGDIVPPGYDLAQLENFDPRQRQLYKSLFSNVGEDSYLSRLAGGDEDIFSEIEAPAFRQFQQLQSGLGSQFSSLAPGALSAQRGSGFQQAQSSAASQFAQDLAAKRQELRRQALSDLMGISHELLGQRPFERAFAQQPQRQPKEEKKLLGGYGPLVGAVGGGLLGSFGGPGGAVAGAGIGSRALGGF
jgi:hypothetical protein